MTPLRRTAWFLMTLAALPVGAYALAMVLLPGLRGEFVAGMVRDTPLSAFAHMGLGAVAIITGAFQFSRWLRRTHLHWHRWMGRVYVVSVGLSGLAGGHMALTTPGGAVAQFGFGGLALCWLITTGMAWRAIRRRDVARHQVWMVRSYALTLAALSLRLVLGPAVASGVPFDTVYPLVAWICWVPNLLIAEWLVLPWFLKPVTKPAPPA